MQKNTIKNAIDNNSLIFFNSISLKTKFASRNIQIKIITNVIKLLYLSSAIASLHSQNMEATAISQRIDKSQPNATSSIRNSLPKSSLQLPDCTTPSQPSPSEDNIQENHNKRPPTIYTTFLSAPPENNEDLDCLDDFDF